MSIQSLTPGAGAVGSTLTYTGIGTGLSASAVSFNTVNGINVGSANPVNINPSGGNIFLGSGSAIYGDNARSQGLGFFGGNEADLYQINKLIFNQDTTIQRTSANNITLPITNIPNLTLSTASTTFATPSIGGAIVGIGCDSATSSVAGFGLSSTTTAFITTPENYPGPVNAYTMLTNSSTVTTYVCAGATVTPTTTAYVVKIIR
jgi:hypothetical protein